MAAALRLLDLLWVAAALLDEVVDVQHFGGVGCVICVSSCL
jgi:hypothetical protein